MGVTGLTSYVQQVLPPAGEPICWPLDQGNEGEATRRQVILIDGNSYVHHVAKEMPNWALGAPHLALIQKLKENIHLWKRAGFLPHFIFDGILPSHKAEERIRRDSEKIGRVNTVLELINNNKNRLGVSQNTVASSIATSLLAPLLIPACIAVINDLGLPVNLPLGEADLCLAKLARDMNAPVLSLDSDFFIHDLDYQQHGSSDEDGPATLSGYIPMNTVQHAPDNISAQVFTRDRVSQSLNIHPAHLPVLAALSGCDYITHVDRHHTTQDLLGTKLKGRSRIKHILTLLEKHKETDSALLVDVLLEGLPECASKELANELKFAIEQYGDGITRSSASTSVEGPIYRLHAKGEFNNKIVEMASYRTFWCTPFLEDTTRASVWDLSRHIRRWIYALVALSSFEPPIWASMPIDGQLGTDYRAGSLKIREYLRRGDRLAAENVVPIPWLQLQKEINASNNSTTKDLMQLANLPNISYTDRESLYLQILSSDTARIRSLPKSQQPLAVSLRAMIVTLSAAGKPLANFEIVAMLCIGLCAVHSISQPIPPPPQPTPLPTPHAPTLHRLAQHESFLLTSLLLSQTLHLAPSTLHHAASLNGPDLHRCMSAARGGASADRLLDILFPTTTGTHLRKQHKLLEAAVFEELESCIDQVMTYSNSAASSPRPSKLSTAEKSKQQPSPIRKKKKKAGIDKGRKNEVPAPPPGLAQANSFDLLQFGCSF